MRPAAGPLAGPVVAAAVDSCIRGRAHTGNSRTRRSCRPREGGARLAPIIRARALAWAIGWADRDEIDCLNILEATLLAMRRALLAAAGVSDPRAGRRQPLSVHLRPAAGVHASRAIVAGECAGSRPSARPSILAKVYRDAMMQALDALLSGFSSWQRNKGYGTPAHLSALQLRAPLAPANRRSFSPLRQD